MHSQPLLLLIGTLLLLRCVASAPPNSATFAPNGDSSSSGSGVGKQDGGKVSLGSSNSRRGANVTRTLSLSRSAVNYAAAFLGAKVVDFQEDATGVRHILNDDCDRYMQIPCSASRKRFTIQLSREIQINMLALSNDEFFSSSIKNFTLVGSREYPCRPPECMWRVLGSFQGEQTQELQLFPVAKHPPVRYVRALWVTYHGAEKSCTMTRFQCYGVDVLDNLAAELSHTIVDTPAVEPEDDDSDDDDDSEGSPQLNGTTATQPANGTGNCTSLLPNGTGLVSGLPICFIAGQNTTGGNLTVNGSTTGSGNATLGAVSALAKKKKDRSRVKDRAPPARNESAVYCLKGSKDAEEYYEFGRGATCAIPTGEKPRTLTATSSKLSASTIHLVLPQQQKLLKSLMLSLQANISRLGNTVATLSDKLTQCRTSQEASFKESAQEKAKLAELLDQLAWFEHRLRTSENMHQLHNEEINKKISGLNSNETGFFVLAIVLAMVALWSLVLNHGSRRGQPSYGSSPSSSGVLPGSGPAETNGSPLGRGAAHFTDAAATVAVAAMAARLLRPVDSHTLLDQLQSSVRSVDSTDPSSPRGETANNKGDTSASTPPPGACRGASPEADPALAFIHRTSKQHSPPSPHHHRLATFESTDELMEVDT